MKKKVAAAAIALAALGGARGEAWGDGGAASLVEREFAAAIQTLSPATVYVVAKPGLGLSTDSMGSSGVIITKSGYLLSDGDAGAYVGAAPGKDGKRPPELMRANEVEVRIPDLKRGTYQVFSAKVVKRVAGIDSCLLKIDNPPASGFPFVTPRTSDGLQVGQFTFAMGMSFGHGEGGGAALTAGVVASLAPAKPGAPGGRYDLVYTSAAVNPGVNGGPLVDVEGGLVGIISTWGEPEKANPFQFLGKAYPIDRIRDAYRDVPAFSTVFPEVKTLATRSKQADLLETAFSATAKAVYPSVVSLEIDRSAEFKMKVPVQDGTLAELPRYTGPVSGLVVTSDGWIVSSGYDFASTTSIVYSAAPSDIAQTFAKIKGVTAHFTDGTSVPAKIVGYDMRVNLVCLKAELPAGYVAKTLEPAPAEEFQTGRLLLCMGNPFGAVRWPSPLLTIGMFSRMHADDADRPWRGQFQTDAGLTDGNCGGAITDVHGRLLGMATIWDPSGQGRNSGIGYGVPWKMIQAKLPWLQAGKTYPASGYMAVILGPHEQGGIKISAVEPGGPADKGGLSVGDVITSIDGVVVQKFEEGVDLLREHPSGSTLKLVVQRGGKAVTLEFVLGTVPDRP